jgi:hypothetical protein
MYACVLLSLSAVKGLISLGSRQSIPRPLFCGMPDSYVMPQVMLRIPMMWYVHPRLPALDAPCQARVFSHHAVGQKLESPIEQGSARTTCLPLAPAPLRNHNSPALSWRMALTFPWLSMPTRAREVQDSCMALKWMAGPVVRGRLIAGSSAERGAEEL